MKKYLLLISLLIIGDSFSLQAMERIRQILHLKSKEKPTVAPVPEPSLEERQKNLTDRIQSEFLKVESLRSGRGFHEDDLTGILLPLRSLFAQDELITNESVNLIITHIKKAFPEKSYDWVREKLLLYFPKREFPLLNSIIQSRIEFYKQQSTGA